jgi:hypothetical protein
VASAAVPLRSTGAKGNGLTSLSDAAAESLGKCEEWLYLDGLTSLSDAAAERLRRCKGRFTASFLFLNGLTSLSDAAAESLSKHEGCAASLYDLFKHFAISAHQRPANVFADSTNFQNSFHDEKH